MFYNKVHVNVSPYIGIFNVFHHGYKTLQINTNLVCTSVKLHIYSCSCSPILSTHPLLLYLMSPGV